MLGPLHPHTPAPLQSLSRLFAMQPGSLPLADARGFEVMAEPAQLAAADECALLVFYGCFAVLVQLAAGYVDVVDMCAYEAVVAVPDWEGRGSDERVVSYFGKEWLGKWNLGGGGRGNEGGCGRAVAVAVCLATPIFHFSRGGYGAVAFDIPGP